MSRFASTIRDVSAMKPSGFSLRFNNLSTQREETGDNMSLDVETQQDVNRNHLNNQEIEANSEMQLEDDSATPKIMRVKKRDGSLQPVDVNKIVNVVFACSGGLKEVDPMHVASKAISGLYDGATTKELDELCIRTAAMLISEEPEYSKLAARLLSRFIDEEVRLEGINNFIESIRVGHKQGLISDDTLSFVVEHKEALNIIIDKTRTHRFEYFGLKTLYDRYLLKHPISRNVIETPQYFFLRVACGFSQSFQDAKEF
ncbi:MAG: ATP cone domain-containing protein [Bdellovibrionales bacterium]